jgi:hypothetical protein
MRARKAICLSADERRNWFNGQFDLAPQRLGIHRRDLDRHQHNAQSRPCAEGERLRWASRTGTARQPRWAGLRMSGMVAPMVLDGPINGDWFEAYLGQVLVPELRPGESKVYL